MDFFEQFRTFFSSHVIASNSLYDRIQYRSELKNKVIFAKNDINVNTFRVEFILQEGCIQGISGLSIALLPDISDNYCHEYPSMIETALLGEIPQCLDISNAYLTYDDICGYSDVNCFYDDESIINEIIRISDYLLSSTCE
jgi:hypothetical protein